MSITIKDLQVMNFSHSFQWHVDFPDYGAYIFPCSIMQDTPFKFDVDEIELGPKSWSYPILSGRGGFSCQIYETKDWDLWLWLEEWKWHITDSTNATVGLLGMPNVTKTVNITNNDYKQQPVTTESLLVIPEGEISYDKSNSKGDLFDISVSFKVVGTV